ncbi:MAG: MFS transporter [Rhodopila sp.]
MSANTTSDAASEPSASRSRLTVVSSIGIGQILVWGSSYYLLAVLAGPIARDTGWPLTWIMGALSAGMVIAGLVSPRVGHLIDRHGGRPVLAGSAVLFAAGMLALAVAPNLPVFVVAWAVLGVAMGAGLYDPAFSALGRLYGDNARSAITQVTLFGGFASTVCWPLSAFLVDRVSWRGTCLTYAAINLLVVLPLYLLGLPREAARAHQTGHQAGPAQHGRLKPELRIAFVVLAAGFTLASVVMTVISVHLLTLLQAQGITLAAAVGLGALIGPSQVGARVLEAAFGRKAHPLWSLLVSTILVAVGLGMLLSAPGVAAAGILLYGSGSGIRSIARGTVPLALFGKEGYAILMGRISMPTLIAQAASPAIGAWLLDAAGAAGTLAVLLGAAAMHILLVIALMPWVWRQRVPASG